MVEEQMVMGDSCPLCMVYHDADDSRGIVIVLLIQQWLLACLHLSHIITTNLPVLAVLAHHPSTSPFSAK
jgi:hypothetical protein